MHANSPLPSSCHSHVKLTPHILAPNSSPMVLSWKLWSRPFRRWVAGKQKHHTSLTTAAAAAARASVDGGLVRTPPETTNYLHVRRPAGAGVDPHGFEAPRNSLELDRSSLLLLQLGLDIPFAVEIVPERKSTSTVEGRTGVSNVVARLMGLDTPLPLQPRRPGAARERSPPLRRALPYDGKENKVPSMHPGPAKPAPIPAPAPPAPRRGRPVPVLTTPAGRFEAEDARRGWGGRRGREVEEVGRVVAEVARRVWEELAEEMVRSMGSRRSGDVI